MAQTKNVESDMLHIQKQLKGAIVDHQILQLKLKDDHENVEVKNRLLELQRYIVTLSASQRRLMKLLKMKNAIRTKSEDTVNKDDTAIPEKRLCPEQKLDIEQSNSISIAKKENLVKEEKITAEELSVNLLEKLRKEFEQEKENIAHSVDMKFGIPLECRNLDEKETFLACIELVTLDRVEEICDVIQKYKTDYALKNPLLEIPKADPSQRRRNETYLSCVPKTSKRRREPSSDRESQVPEEAAHEGGSFDDLPDGPDQPFNEHQFSQESVTSTYENEVKSES